MKLSSRTAAGGFLSFVLIGCVSAVYGPLIPGLRATFSLSAADAGLMLGAQFVGSALGIVASGLLESRVGPRNRVWGAAALLAFGCLGVVLAPGWTYAVVAALVIGLGFGGLNVAYFALFATGFGARSATMMNLLTVSYGAGTVVGPLVVGRTLESGFRLPFLLVAIAALLVLPLALRVPGALPAVAGGHVTSQPAGPPAWKVLAGFAVLYFLYNGLESSAGGWQATHLAANGVAATTAANLTALYWGTLTVGRLMIAPFSPRIPPGLLVVVCLALGAAAFSLTHVPSLSVFAYPLAGLAMAPFFPAGLIWLGQLLPTSRGTVAVALIGAHSGGVVFPTLIGQLITATDPAVVPSALTAIGLLGMVVAVVVQRIARATAPAAATQAIAADSARRVPSGFGTSSSYSRLSVGTTASEPTEPTGSESR